MYPSEFEAGDPGFTPIDAPLFLGLPPLLGVILILALLLVAVAMYLLGRWQATRSGGVDADRAPEEIYAAIRRHATEARAAGSHELRHKAEILARKIDDYLGPVMVVGRDLGALTKALKAAGEGRMDAPAKHAPAETRPAAPACGCTPGRPCACTASPVSINQIYIGAPAPAPVRRSRSRPCSVSRSCSSRRGRGSRRSAAAPTSSPAPCSARRGTRWTGRRWR